MPEPGGVTTDETGADRVFTIPNVISLIRLLCLPLFLYLLFGRDNQVAAAVLLGALGATDWVDGYIARHYDQVSDLGKILDPVADRLLFFVGVGGILVAGDAPVVFSVLVLVREAFVAVAVVTLGLLGAKRIDVTWFGKAGTFGLMFAFPLFLLGASTLRSAPVFQALGWMAGIPGLLLAYYAAVLYVPIGLRALREGRAARRTTGATA